MTTAREAFEAKKLATKYGITGKVAGAYRTAGYHVEMVSTEDQAPYNFIASKKGERLTVKVYSRTGRVPVEVAESLASAAAEKNAKPILVLYGSGPKVTAELVDKAKQLGVSMRRFRS